MPITLGQPVMGSVTSGSPESYAFSISQPMPLYFDSLGGSSARFTLNSESGGALLNNQSFSLNENLLDPIWALPGDYQVVVDASSGTHDYSFQISLLDDSVQELADPFDNSFQITLAPAESTVLRRFDATAGQRLFLDSDHFNGSIFADWRLFDSHGQPIFNDSLTDDVPNVVIEEDGTYYLAIEGYIFDTVSMPTVDITIHEQTVDTANITVMGQRTELNLTATTPGTTFVRTFTTSEVDADISLVSVDVQNSTATYRWTLTTSDGRDVFSNASGDGEFHGLPDTYTLTITPTGDSTGTINIAITDVDRAANGVHEYEFGTPYSRTFEPGTRDVGRFVASAGDRLFVDQEDNSAGGEQSFQIRDPRGNIVTRIRPDLDVNGLALNLDGIYSVIAASDDSEFTTTLHLIDDTPQN